MKKTDYFSRENLKRVYSTLMDDESRHIFEARLNYSLTGSERYMRPVIKMAENKVMSDKRWNDLYRLLVDEKSGLYIYGCGMYGKELFLMSESVRWKGFIDGKVSGGFGGLRIFTPEEFIKSYSGEKVVISSADYKKEMTDELIKMGIMIESIIDGTMLPLVIESYQYFDLPELKQVDYEVFADVGAYDGMTSVRFHEWCHGNGKSICFEPDRTNIERLKCNLKSQKIDFCVIEKGLWDSDTELRFAEEMGSISHIVEGSSDNTLSTIPVTTIDSIFENEDVTFIKMDIEGAEQKALLGAENTIKRCRPKLAICVYHKPEDIWEIPLTILGIFPDYQFYLRHYSLHNGETVLYSI